MTAACESVVVAAGVEFPHSPKGRLSLEPASILSAARRRWWVIVLLAALGGLVGAIPSSQRSVDATTTWTASHTLLLSTTSVNDSVFSDPVAFNQLQLFAVTGEVPRRVAEVLNYPGVPAALAAQVSVEVDTSNAALKVTTSQTSAQSAVTIADAFADQLVTYLAERQDELQADRVAAALVRLEALETEITALEPSVAAAPTDQVLAAQLAALSRQYEAEFEGYRSLQVEEGQIQLTTLERAQPIAITEQGLSAPKSRTGRALLAAGVGAMAGLAVAILWSRTDRRIRTRVQAEAIFGLRSQVAIPSDGKTQQYGVVVLPGRHDMLSDSYRTLRSVVGFVEAGLPDRGGRAPVALVLSAGAGDGKTSVAANLAAAFVETGLTTVAVNTDFRRPALSERILGRKPDPIGFFAADLPELPVSMVTQRSPIEHLSVFDLTGAIGSPGDLARVTARMLGQLSREYAAVVVDSSPVGATAEVLEIVPRADVIVVVVRLGHTYIESATRTIEIIRTLTQAPLLLTVVGEAPERPDYYEYGARPLAARKRKLAKSRA